MAAWGPKSQGATPLHLAAQGGHLKVMDELLERGADIDARTKGACGCMCLTFSFHCLPLNLVAVLSCRLYGILVLGLRLGGFKFQPKSYYDLNQIHYGSLDR